MKTWKIETTEKKNVYQRQMMSVGMDSEIAPGKEFFIDEWYRWGYALVASDDKPEQSSDPYIDPIVVSDYEVEDQNLDDGVSLSFEFPEGWTEEEIAWVENLYEQDGWSAFDENNIWIDDVETHFYGPVEVELIADTPDEPEDDDLETPPAAWPFPT